MRRPCYELLAHAAGFGFVHTLWSGTLSQIREVFPYEFPKYLYCFTTAIYIRHC